MQMMNIPPGVLGYRGAWGQAWIPSPYPGAADWAGTFMSTHAEDAVGYIASPTGHESGTGALFRVTIGAEMRAVSVPQGTVPNPAAIRTFVTAQAYVLNPNLHLIDALSAVQLAYVGPSAPPAYEVVLSAPFVAGTTQHQQVATVTVTNGQPDFNHIRLATGQTVTRAQLDGILPPAPFPP